VSGYKSWSSGDILTASDVNTYLMAGGLMAATTGPSSQTDYSALATVVTQDVALVNGRNYLVTGTIVGTQITNVGTPTVKILIAGTEVCRPMTGGSLNTSQTGSGSASWVYTAVATSTITFLLNCQDTASAFRVAANAAQIAVIQIG